jgi:ribose/xylose/arabinose/galactoside ABC-type transport system permease subunit
LAAQDELSVQSRRAESTRHAALEVLERVGILPILMVAMLLVFSVTSQYFWSLNNIDTILNQSVYLVIVAVAQMLVIITGGFDLSVGASLALVSIFTSMALKRHPGDPAAGIAEGVLIGIAVATVIGVANGLVISVCTVSPFIVTLATASIVSGYALIVTSGIPVFGIPAYYANVLYTGKLAGIHIPWLVAALVIVLLYLLIRYTRPGRYWYAIGGNAAAARLSGIRVRVFIFLAYVTAGLLVGIGGVLLTARVGSGEPNLGSTVPLESIAAAVLGGVSLRGGEGSVFGAVLGAIFLVLLRNGMDLMGISSYLELVVTGLFLIFAIVVDRYIHQRG